MYFSFIGIGPSISAQALLEMHMGTAFRHPQRRKVPRFARSSQDHRTQSPAPVLQRFMQVFNLLNKRRINSVCFSETETKCHLLFRGETFTAKPIFSNKSTLRIASNPPWAVISQECFQESQGCCLQEISAHFRLLIPRLTLKQ